MVENNAEAVMRWGGYDPYLLDGGIISEWLSGSQLQANLRGATTHFTNNTPQYVADYSVALFQQGQRAAQDIVDFGGTVDYSKTDVPYDEQDFDFQKRLRELAAGAANTARVGVNSAKQGQSQEATIDELYKPGGTIANIIGEENAAKVYAEILKNRQAQPESFLTSLSARVGLISLGIVITALGVWALR